MTIRLRSFILLLIFLAAFPVLVTATPWLEQRFWPPKLLRVINPVVVRSALFFSIDGIKLRPCQLLAMTMIWDFISGRKIADVYLASTGMVLKPSDERVFDNTGKLIQRPPWGVEVGDHFIYGPLYTPIPPAAFSAGKATLAVAFFDDCHPVYTVEQRVAVTVALDKNNVWIVNP